VTTVTLMKAKHYPTLARLYGSKQECRRRFWSYQKKQKAIKDIINNICPEKQKDKTIIAFGGAKFAVTGKGLEATPVRGLLQELSRKRKVILVDEYKTTQISHCCKSDTLVYKGPISKKKLKDRMNKQYDTESRSGILRQRYKYDFTTCNFNNMKKTLAKTKKRYKYETITPDTAYPYQMIHGLRQCKHCARFLNRDMNAATNIGECFIQQYTTGTRHAAFTRQPKSTISSSIKKRKLSRIEPVNGS
jgi:hypothetical protein